MFCEKCGTELATGAIPDEPLDSGGPQAARPVSHTPQDVRDDLKDLADLTKQGLIDDTIPPAPLSRSQRDCPPTLDPLPIRHRYLLPDWAACLFPLNQPVRKLSLAGMGCRLHPLHSGMFHPVSRPPVSD